MILPYIVMKNQWKIFTKCCIFSARGDLMVIKKLLELNEYNAAGLFEEPDRGLFYRKALGLKRFYENCNLTKYNGDLLYCWGETAMTNN